MRISRRGILLGAVAAASGCEEQARSGKAEGELAAIPAAAPGDSSTVETAQAATRAADPGDLSSVSTPYDGSTIRSVYIQVVNKVLLHRVDSGRLYEPVICQMLVHSDAEYESALFLQRSPAGWRLIVRRAIASLGAGVWMRLENGMEPSRIAASMAGSMEEWVRPLSQHLAGTLQTLWTEMLLRTRAHSTPELDLHTAQYHFAHHHLAGVTIRADKQSRAGRFVRLGRELLDSTNVSGPQAQVVLDEAGAHAATLLKELSQLHDIARYDSAWELRKLYGEPERRR